MLYICVNNCLFRENIASLIQFQQKLTSVNLHLRLLDEPALALALAK